MTINDKAKTTWTVHGYATVSVHATVNASSEAEAREIFESLMAPGLCHQCSGAGEGTEDSGEVQLNGFDDVVHAVDAEPEEAR